MKRTATEAGLQAKRSPWQLPASCNFCRLKKIRCDKKHPCSSCTLRGVECEYAWCPGPLEDSSMVTEQSNAYLILEQPLQRISDRLDRLENLLLGLQGSQEGRPSSSTAQTCDLQPSSAQDGIADSQDKTWDDLEAVMANTECSDNTELRSQSEALIPMLSASNPQPEKEIESIQRLLALLPDIRCARLLFQHYVEVVDCLHRELHVPYTQVLLETMYSQLSQSVNVGVDVIVLFLCIFASSSFYVCSKDGHALTSELARAETSHLEWKLAALKLILDPTDQLGFSVVALQSMLIMLYLLWDSEGQSETFLRTFAVAYSKAIHMRLHRMDAYAEYDGDAVEKELKRRLWWHLTCTDWLLAGIPGKREGVYSINPNQICVKYPSNQNDESICYGAPLGAGAPLDQPTDMCYFLWRLRFAELCREVLDAMQKVKPGSSSAPYELTVQLSQRYMAFLGELPWFFRPDMGAELKISRLAVQRPYILRQRTALLFGVFSRLGRLHRPFIARGIKDTKFAASYRTGIYCAENLFKLRAIRDAGDSCTCFCSHSIDQHCFNALLLLSIDFLGGNRRRKEELIQMCVTLKTGRVCPGSKRGFSRAINQLLTILERADGEGTLGTTGHRDICNPADVVPAYSTAVRNSSGPSGQANQVHPASDWAFTNDMTFPEIITQDMDELLGCLEESFPGMDSLFTDHLSGGSSENSVFRGHPEL